MCADSRTAMPDARAAHTPGMSTPQKRQPRCRPTGGRYAETEHTEPEVTLNAAPKPARRRTPKGGTSTLTLPDGTTVSNTTSVGRYTHALVLPPEDPELVRETRTARLAAIDAQIGLIDQALSGTGRNLAMQSNAFHSPGEDPDLRADGAHSYDGFKIRLMADDWETMVAQTWCDSRQMVQGAYDEHGVHSADGVQHARDYLSGQATAVRNVLVEERAGHLRALEELDAGIYDLGGYKAVTWSGMAGSLEASLADWAKREPTRPPYVAEVDA